MIVCIVEHVQWRWARNGRLALVVPVRFAVVAEHESKDKVRVLVVVLDLLADPVHGDPEEGREPDGPQYDLPAAGPLVV